jgi:hypothetical protein
MAERGRKPGFRMTNEHRVKIQNSNILNALIEHVEGIREMSATQVSAGLGLLKKIMPDLAATADVTGDGELKPVSRMTDDELEAIAAGRSSGASPAPEGSRQLN